MSTENQVPTGEETQNPPPETVDETKAVIEPVEEVKEPDEDETQKAIKRLQRRIDKRTSDVYRERARAEQLEAELQRLRGQPEEKTQEPDLYVKAEQIANAKVFAKTAEQIVETGRKSNSDFIDRLKDLASEVGEFVKPNGLPSEFMQAVMDVSDKPADLLYYLGKNPDVASELADLPITKQAARLARIERELSEPGKKQSSAPKPLEPVKSSSSDVGYIGNKNISDSEWAERREKELIERRKRI